MQSRRNQTGNMRHIHKKVSSDFVANLSKFFKIDNPGISGSPRDKHFRFMFFGQRFNFIEIQHLGFRIDLVRNDFIRPAGKIHFMPVR